MIKELSMTVFHVMPVSPKRCGPRIIATALVGLSLVISLFAGAVSAKTEAALPGKSLPEAHSVLPTDNTVFWPHEKSDLKPDPSVHFGRLTNGFRYALMNNAEPKNRVSMHLVVEAGSLNETDEEQGLAHFLEHMLFNGSTHFKPGELVKYFQNIGMQFGPDANAHTGFNQTVYDILLPDGSSGSISDGLLVLSDYADGALLLEEEIERERHVVLAEKRTRDSASYRTFVSTLSFELPDVRISKRLPIGREEVIRNADRKLMKDFYDAWYRPETMILVMVGDFDVNTAVPLIQDRFGKMTGRAPPRDEPDFGTIDHQGDRAFFHFENESGNTSVSIEMVKKVQPQRDSVTLQKERLTLDVANRIVQERLNAMLSEPDTPFTSAQVGAGVFLRQMAYADISADCKPENWDRSLQMLDRSLRQALEYGFTADELNRVKQDLISALENAVKNAPTRKSAHLSGQLIGSLGRDRVFQSPSQRLEMLRPWVEQMTTADVHRAFTESWRADHRLVLLTGNAYPLSGVDDPEDKILSVYSESRRVAVSRPEAYREVSFPYLPEPDKPGEILKRHTIDDMDILQVDFKNGVRLNFKRTPFEANQVQVKVTLEGGRATEPASRSGLAVLSGEVINESGLGALNKNELERALAGKTVGVGFGLDDDHFIFSGAAVSGETRLLFQLLYAHLLDPAFRQTAYQLAMSRFDQQYKELNQTVDGAMVLSGRRFLAGNDHRFGLPEYERFQQLTLTDIRAWLEPVLKQSPIEVSVVGDVDSETVVRLAARYFGSLPSRGAFQTPVRDSINFPVNKKLPLTVDTKIPKGLLVVAFPTDDIWNISRTRRLAILAEIFSDRLRERVREKLGAAYSPFAYNRPSRAYRGYGVFQAHIQAAPDDLLTIEREVKAIASSMAENGVTDDELKRALEPTLTSIKDLRRQNRYWLNTVLSGSRAHPQQIDWSRSIMADYASITTSEISALARKYLVTGRSATIRISPGDASAITTGSACGSNAGTG